MNKRIINIISVILLLFVCFVAMTDEPEVIPVENIFERQEAEDNAATAPLSIKESALWFQSNSGGLAIKEIKSRIIALRNEYALSIESAYPYELPVFLEGFYKDEYNIEVRTLFKNAKQNRVQWLFRDNNNNIKLIAVVFESLEEKTVTVTVEAEEVIKDAEIAENKEENEKKEPVKVTENRTEMVERKTGFIEIYNDESNLLKEYSYYKNGDIYRIDFEYNENKLINAVSYKSVQDEEEKYTKIFTDFYFYNRSLAIRAIERVFFVNMIAKENDIVKISFPRNIRNMTNNDFVINERLNLYPEFFGDVLIENESKLVFDIDNRGRVLKQTLYNDDKEVVWVITNTWKNNRIILTEKVEGDLKLAAEFTYNSAGDKISEKNYNNGVLERTVVADGNLEIEELYFDNVVILRAVWEEGIKISETRVK